MITSLCFEVNLCPTNLFFGLPALLSVPCSRSPQPSLTGLLSLRGPLPQGLLRPTPQVPHVSPRALTAPLIRTLKIPPVLHLPTSSSPSPVSILRYNQLLGPEVAAGMSSGMAPTSGTEGGAPRKALWPVTYILKREVFTSFGFQPYPRNYKRIKTNKHLLSLSQQARVAIKKKWNSMRFFRTACDICSSLVILMSHSSHG